MDLHTTRLGHISGAECCSIGEMTPTKTYGEQRVANLQHCTSATPVASLHGCFREASTVVFAIGAQARGMISH